MAQKLQQAMVALSEDSRDMKMALRMMLKYEVQMLLERLQELGDDSLLLMANGSEGTMSHLGTQNGNMYLNNCQSVFQLNLKETFLQACSSGGGNMNQDNLGGYQGNMAPDSLLGGGGMGGRGGGMGDMSGHKFKGKQLGYEGNRNHPYNAPYNQPLGQSQMNNQQGPHQQGPHSQGPHNQGRSRNYSKDEVSNIVNSNHKICVNFLLKGHCQKGSSCGFIHTQDEKYIDALVTKPEPGATRLIRKPELGSTRVIRKPELGGTGGGTQRNHDRTEGTVTDVPPGAKRKICRHFARGHCWMENSCSFLHVNETPDEKRERLAQEKEEER